MKIPFGLRNSGSTFQCLMHQVLGHLPFCFIYVDKLLVASESKAEHLQTFFALLWANHLVINEEKCILGKKTMTFLGPLVDGIRPLPSHVFALNKFPLPTTRLDVQKFLGLLNFYRKFCGGLAEVVKPLTDSLSGRPADFKVTPDLLMACNRAKEMLF